MKVPGAFPFLLPTSQFPISIGEKIKNHELSVVTTNRHKEIGWMCGYMYSVSLNVCCFNQCNSDLKKSKLQLVVGTLASFSFA